MEEFPQQEPEPQSPAQETAERPKPAWLVRKEYTDPADKKRDFWLGVGVFFLLNILLGGCWFGLIYFFTSASYASEPAAINQYSDLLGGLLCVLSLVPWAINFGLLIYFALTRSQMALGMLAGFGIALAIVLLLGVVFAVWCFASLNGSML